METRNFYFSFTQIKFAINEKKTNKWKTEKSKKCLFIKCILLSSNKSTCLYIYEYTTIKFPTLTCGRRK